MVGLDTWQTPPAIEQKIAREDREQWGGTTGGIRNGAETRQEDEIESSTLSIQGKTSADVKMVTQTKEVKSAEDRPRREGEHTTEFSEYLFNRKTAEMISLLNDLKPNLQQIEGAGIMTVFRRSLEEIWHVAGRLPTEKVLVVSAVEEAVRNKKWRELSVGQVDVLQRVLSNVSTPVEISRLEVSRAFRAINRSRIDVFPSALVEEEQDDELEPDAAE
jgi:hypothetical protein